MKYIDIENWERKNHYNYFKTLDYPHFNICANLDITKFYHYIKENGHPFFLSILYASVKTANMIKEFRYRIREDKVVEHDVVHPSFTLMTSKDVFSFCTAIYTDHYHNFILETEEKMKRIKESVNIEDEPGRDDLLYISSIPWVSFTSITHAVHMNPVDSMPRITWGKFFEENGMIKLPFSVQGHHALLDGLHVGQYFNLIQEILNDPDHKL